MAVKLIVGLNNPGKDYEGTRHNAGAMCVELLVRRLGLKLEPKTAARVAQGALRGRQIILATPRTFMNASGEAVGPLTKQYGVKPAELVVAYDEMDLPLGTIRLRPDGSAAGHNGIKSIIAALGTDQFMRIRIGVGHPRGGDRIRHVLGKFSPEEEPVFRDALERAADAIECLITEGVDVAMNRFNRRPPEEPQAPLPPKPE
ncbi:MAG: aminoacyl-tRNA hydrolase [Dehalococcoidia bacterium]|nr:aminoacyl-tRNA hydrolase [Dehalococcoidia bacterium]